MVGMGNGGVSLALIDGLLNLVCFCSVAGDTVIVIYTVYYCVCVCVWMGKCCCCCCCLVAMLGCYITVLGEGAHKVRVVCPSPLVFTLIFR